MDNGDKQMNYIRKGFIAFLLGVSSFTHAQISAIIKPETQTYRIRYADLIINRDEYTHVDFKANGYLLSLAYQGASLVPGNYFGTGWCLGGVNGAPSFLNRTDIADELELDQCGRKTRLKVIASLSSALKGENIHAYLSERVKMLPTDQYILADIDQYKIQKLDKPESAKTYREIPLGVRLELRSLNNSIHARASIFLASLNEKNSYQDFDKYGRTVVFGDSSRVGFKYIGDTRKIDIASYVFTEHISATVKNSIVVPARRFHYDDKNRVVKIDNLISSARDKASRWHFVYNNENMLVSIQHNEEAPQYFTYDARQRLSDVMASDGLRSAFFYEGSTEKLSAYMRNERTEVIAPICFSQYNKLTGNSVSLYKVVETQYCGDTGEKSKITEFTVKVNDSGLVDSESSIMMKK